MLTYRSTCNVSSPAELDTYVPRQGHRPLSRRDATIPPRADYPSRRHVAYSIVIVMVLLSFTTVAGMHGHNWLALLGVAGVATAGTEVADELAERRYYRRGGRA
jgi:hypothetical protein